MGKKKAIEVYISNRNINSKDIQQMEMEQIAAQLAAISDQLTQLGQKQAEHDQVLTYLNQKTEIPPPPQPQRDERVTIDLFRIPDPIKSIPSFDGNKKQLSAWLTTAEDTLRVFEPLVTAQQFSLYIQAIQNKVEGKAKDILCLAGNPRTFHEMKEILLESLGDKQELSYYKSQLWSTKQNDLSVHVYFNKIKEIVQNIKSLAKQKPQYNQAWLAINAFIEEDALAAFVSGLRKPYFGYAQAAKPQNLEEAYAFLCKFSSNESISGNSKKFNNQTKNSFQPKNNSEQANPKNQQWPVQEKLTPMEVDPSIRSRRTFKNTIHNIEIPNDIEKEPEVEVQNMENFWEDHNSDPEG